MTPLPAENGPTKPPRNGPMKPPRSGNTVLDLFAGPGGWDVAATDLGLNPLGIEWDDAACATRKAAGLRTQQADVATLDTADFSPIWGLIGSPPCQAWSMAGKGGGRRDKELCVRAALELAAGNDTRAELREQCEDVRSMLVVEPLRFALDLRPEWIVLEQVPPVIEMWTLFAQILTEKGYSVWAGVLEAERYGVPQTRERAILMASRTEQVHPPAPTHQRYVKGEPQRHDVTFDGEILPWVSMAQALGWDEGSAAYKLARGEGMLERYGDRRAVPDEEPAPVVTSKARTATWTLRTGMNSMSTSRDPQDMIPYERPVSDPAPTVDGKVGGAWKVAPEGEHKDAPQAWKWRDGRSEEFQRGDVPVDSPAPTIGSTTRLTEWVHEQPAPTVTTTRRSKDGLIIGRQLPAGEGEEVGGWKFRADNQENACIRDEDEPAPTMRFGHACNQSGWIPADQDGDVRHIGVRVTVEQAAALQTFPRGYPWQGSRTKQFEQVGNAVPPLLAWHVLRAIVPTEAEAQRAA